MVTALAVPDKLAASASSVADASFLIDLFIFFIPVWLNAGLVAAHSQEHDLCQEINSLCKQVFTVLIRRVASPNVNISDMAERHA
jgi:hypothetical protein